MAEARSTRHAPAAIVDLDEGDSFHEAVVSRNRRSLFGFRDRGRRAVDEQ